MMTDVKRKRRSSTEPFLPEDEEESFAVRSCLPDVAETMMTDTSSVMISSVMISSVMISGE